MSDQPVIAAYATVYTTVGAPVAFQHEGVCYFGLAEASDPRCVPVSREFYEAFVAEFAGKSVVYGGKRIAVQTPAGLDPRTLDFTVLEPAEAEPAQSC